MNNQNYISAEEARVTSVCWFGVDMEEHIAMLYSGGAGIPSVLTWANVEKIYNYFLEDAPVVSESAYEPYFLSLLSPKELEGYLKHENDPSDEDVLAASKGVYTIDGTLHDPCDINYYRVRIPTNPLFFQDLPIDIQKCFEGERLPISFAEVKVFEDRVIPNRI